MGCTQIRAMDWHRNHRPGAGRRALHARLGLPCLIAAALLVPACASAAPLPTDSSPPQALTAASLPEATDTPSPEALPDALYPAPPPAAEALAQWSSGERADLPSLAAVPGLASVTELLLTLLSATSAPQFEAAGLSPLGEALRRDDRLGDELLASLGTAIDSDLANRILAAGIGLPAAQPGLARTRPYIVMGRVRALSANGAPANPGAKPAASPPDPGPSLSSLASQNFGQPDTLALGLREHVGDGAALRTDVDIRHAHGPLDVDFNLSGNQPLTTEKPMALAYTGAAFVSLGDSLKVGMTAKGDLGTISAPSPFREQTGSAVARWQLLGKNSVLSAETGYDFPLGTPGSASQPQFHMNLNLDLKL
jgi:hypothetical protein